MEEHEGQNLSSLTQATHLQVPPSGSGEMDLLATKSSSETDERPSLTNLAGELEDLIITNLHPSAALTLNQTSRHFHSSVSLHRLPFSEVFDWFQKKEQLSTNTENYACYTCLRLRPRSTFAKGQTKSPRGKNGTMASLRICLDCGFSTGKHTPGSIMYVGGELQVRCIGCDTLRKRFCRSCRWCDGCISKGFAVVLRKAKRAGPNGEAREVTVHNSCGEHVWDDPKPVRSGHSRSFTQWSVDWLRNHPSIVRWANSLRILNAN